MINFNQSSNISTIKQSNNISINKDSSKVLIVNTRFFLKYSLVYMSFIVLLCLLIQQLLLPPKTSIKRLMQSTFTQTQSKLKQQQKEHKLQPDKSLSKTTTSKLQKSSSKKKKPSQIGNLEIQFTSIMDKKMKKIQNPALVVTNLIKLLTKYAYKLPQYASQTHQMTKQSMIKEQQRQLTGDEIVLPSRKKKKVRKEQQKQKYEERKFIAFAFCEHGINLHFATQRYPDINPKSYRCTVEAVNNQAVNDIINFMRYECNVQVQRLNRSQKHSIRTQLTKIRQWLGNRDPQQLETFYKFIYRYYDKSVEITFEKALKLYKTIIQIIKSPFVNVLEVQQDRNINGDRSGLIPQEQIAMIILYIKYKDYSKVSDGMGQKYGYNKWSFQSVRAKLRKLLQTSIDKLISSITDIDIQSVFTKSFTRKKRDLLQESNEIGLKIKLYSFYLEKKPTNFKVIDLINNLSQFFELYDNDSTNISLPKLEQSEMTAFLRMYKCKSVFSIFCEVNEKEEATTEEEESEVLLRLEQA